MKILITGSRKLNHYDIEYIQTVLDAVINKQMDVVIHGGAKGTDTLAEEWCKNNGVKTTIVKPICPDKKEHYLYRNAEMVGMCDKVFAFWDGKSRGTSFTFEYAKKRKKQVNIFHLMKG